MNPVVRREASLIGPLIAFSAVVVAQLALIALAGTDVPFHDQWDSEGVRLYPEWREGTFSFQQLFERHNEHRIVWTQLLNLALFEANGGRWDPLVQQVAGAILHGLAAGVLVWLVGGGFGRGASRWVPWIVAVAFLPVAGWHNALWGFQSHVYFAVLFSLIALGMFDGERGGRSMAIGVAAAIAALLSMGAGAFVPAAVLAIAVLRWREGAWSWWQLGVGAGLMALSLAFYLLGDAHAPMRTASLLDSLAAFGRMAAWPHVDQPLVALILNIPFLLILGRRLLGKIPAAPCEYFALAVGLWLLALAAATAWARGGEGELAVGVPSRYVDFFVLLPLVNLGCLWLLLQRIDPAKLRLARLLALVWTAFLMVGWLGISAEAVRRILLPRARDRDAPVRLIQEFQRTGDPAVFAGQPRLHVPHPKPEVALSVIRDARMQGALPPSLQPESGQGALSRAVRFILGRE